MLFTGVYNIYIYIYMHVNIISIYLFDIGDVYV